MENETVNNSSIKITTNFNYLCIPTEKLSGIVQILKNKQDVVFRQRKDDGKCPETYYL
jgi:hypothetical protein